MNKTVLLTAVLLNFALSNLAKHFILMKFVSIPKS